MIVLFLFYWLIESGEENAELRYSIEWTTSINVLRRMTVSKSDA